MNLGSAIQMCRVRRGLKLAQLAERTELSVSYLSLIEKNNRDVPISTLEAIAKAIGVPASILLFLAAGPEEMDGIDGDLRARLSHAALSLISEKATA
ncbi:MAG: helix-turn-helix transcriptional regulator [Kiritimatiellae bacterium]|nr:helix-turn-helix transcriptional regulator [Kiritimatiellia bacterium]